MRSVWLSLSLALLCCAQLALGAPHVDVAFADLLSRLVAEASNSIQDVFELENEAQNEAAMLHYLAVLNELSCRLFYKSCDPALLREYTYDEKTGFFVFKSWGGPSDDDAEYFPSLVEGFFMLRNDEEDEDFSHKDLMRIRRKKHDRKNLDALKDSSSPINNLSIGPNSNSLDGHSLVTPNAYYAYGTIPGSPAPIPITNVQVVIDPSNKQTMKLYKRSKSAGRNREPFWKRSKMYTVGLPPGISFSDLG